jgi:hypothetical protein
LEDVMRSRNVADLTEEQPDASTAHVGALEQQNAELRAQLAGDRHFDRRGVLRLGGVAAAIGASSVLLRPQAAGATTGAMQFGQQNDAGGDSTGLASSNITGTLQVSNGSGAPAVLLRSSGAALVANGADDAGVLGITGGAGAGVLGRADVGTGPAVRAEIDSQAATADALDAAQNGKGSALHAHTKGTGSAVLAAIENTASRAPAVRAQTAGSGTGLSASSAQGIGAKFAGKTAPILLVPSSAPSHPASGAAGELFVDHANRLWFCKGGTNWRQLA